MFFCDVIKKNRQRARERASNLVSRWPPDKRAKYENCLRAFRDTCLLSSAKMPPEKVTRLESERLGIFFLNIV